MPPVIDQLFGNQLAQHLRRLSRPFRRFAVRSYSQEGEDMVLRRMFEGKMMGFYVDVGACHPFRFSNTNYFYRLGWRGINIDATPGSMSLFRAFRPRDINIEAAISIEAGETTFYIFEESALNSLESPLSEERISHGWPLKRTEIVPTRSLCSILTDYLPLGQQIDFMTIDAEGHDLPILRSNDWSRFRPACLVVELLGSSLADTLDSETSKYLGRFEYTPYAKTVNSVFFLDNAQEIPLK